MYGGNTDKVQPNETSGPKLGRRSLEVRTSSSYTRFIESFRLGLFGVMHILNNDSVTSTSFVAFSTFAEVLQLISFCFSPMFQWNESIINVVASVVSSFRLSFFFKPKLFWVACVGANILVILTILHAVFVGHSFASGRLKLVWTFWIMRLLCRLLLGFLLMPITSILLETLDCDTVTHLHNIDPSITCWTGFHMSLSVLSTFTLSIFIIFVSWTSLMFVNRDAMSACSLAASTGRVNFIVLWVKFIVDLSFTVSNNANFLILVLLLSGAVLVFSFLYYIPFYSHVTNKIMVIGYASYLWTAVCALIAHIIKDTTDNAAFMVLLVPLPLVLFSAKTMVDWRREDLSATSMEHISSQWLLPAKLFPIVSTTTMNDGTFAKLIDSATTKFPRSVCVRLFASMCYDNSKNGPLAIQMIRECEALEPSMDHSFVLFRRNRLEDEAARGGTIAFDAMSLFKIEHHEKEMERNIHLCHNSIILFWEELSSKSCSFLNCTAISVS